MPYPDGMLMRSTDTRSPYFVPFSGSNYSAALSQDIETAQNIRAVVESAQSQVEKHLARVNDTGAFDMPAITACFEDIGTSIPTDATLIERAE